MTLKKISSKYAEEIILHDIKYNKIFYSLVGSKKINCGFTTDLIENTCQYKKVKSGLYKLK